MFERQSPVNSASCQTGRNAPDGQRRLQLGEMRGWNLIQVAGFAANEHELPKALQPLLSVDLPTRVGSAVTAAERLLMKIGPHMFWVITPESEDLVASLREVVAPATGSVTPLSNSRHRLFIMGPQAWHVLSTDIPLDLHPAVFAVHNFALTSLHHTPIVVHRSATDRYELYPLRSFAQWTWEWLTDVAHQFGYDILRPA